MKYITLTQGKVATVCDCHYDLVAQHHWYVTNWGYAISDFTTEKVRVRQLMHRLIMSNPKGSQVDHRDTNKLNNQCSNLRVATASQNRMNVPIKSNNTSGYKGVCWDKSKNKWQAGIGLSGKNIFLGRFDKIEDAALAYREAAVKYHGEFART